jgi:hypothetical protein
MGLGRTCANAPPDWLIALSMGAPIMVSLASSQTRIAPGR